MSIRWILTVCIIAFWAVMTGLLIQLAYFPAESRLAAESPVMVTERFLSRQLESSLDIWKGREIVGALWVEPRAVTPEERKRTNVLAWVQTRGVLLLHFPGQPERRLRVESNLAMTREGEVKQSDLELRLDDIGVGLVIHQAGEEMPQFRLSIGDQILLDSTDPNGGDTQSQALLKLLLGAAGTTPMELGRGQSAAKAEAASARTEARRGIISVSGTQFAGYILKTQLGEGRDVTLHLSESGEIIQMKCSFLDYQFLSEDLRPVDVVAPDISAPPRHPAAVLNLPK